MRELRFFFKPGCPYCRQAEKLIGELFTEHPEYRNIVIDRIDENANAELAAKYDYWYVPTFYIGEEKVYEADSSDAEETVKKKLNQVFQKAL